jgi:hypothetical protein
MSTHSGKADFALNVKDSSGKPVSNFRWILEEDNTGITTPGQPRMDSPSLKMHKSHAPLMASGSGADGLTQVICDSSRRYLVSVLADGFEMSGRQVKVSQATVAVILNTNPIPTAQISILAFHDNAPINNVPDAGEAGLGGFMVALKDVLGGPIMTDTFGNPLGTTYKFATTGSKEPLMIDGAPVVAKMGTGRIYTDANGKALVKYLAMGKYGVQLIPPVGTTWTSAKAGASIVGKWHQTGTIEGTQTIDAWVKANEPSIFIEGFGAGNYHVFFGFTDPAKTAWGVAARRGGVTVSGTLRFNHFGRPPNNQQNVMGPPVGDGMVALNEINALGTAGRGLTEIACDPATGSFAITNVPPGTYQLVSWDKPLDALFNTVTITVGSTPLNVGDVPMMRWFGTYEGSVFYDKNQNGFRDPTDLGMPNQILNLRYRDGSVYMSTLSDEAGDFSMSEVFPFFKWLVAEVGFERFKATGGTAVVDDGGTIPPDAGWAMPSEGKRNPQPQFEVNPDGSQITTSPITNPNTGNNLSRTWNDPVGVNNLLQASMLFLNQNNRIDWGKAEYARGENGGIAGLVGYGNTRAELDPREGTVDPWEPLVPRVQVALYQDANADGIIDDLNGDGHPTPADVDNYPFGWRAGEAKGPEDVDHNGDGVFHVGDAIQMTWTDSWDDSQPQGSQQPQPPMIGGQPIIGADTYATWNQIRPGLFDGGYAFTTYFPGGLAQNNTQTAVLPAGDYIVQAFPPPGYLIQTEESFNVLSGNDYKPSKLALMPELVGTAQNHVGDLEYVKGIVSPTRTNVFVVPNIFSLFPDSDNSGGDLTPLGAGQVRPLADMKRIHLADQKNAAADFHVYTEVAKATRVHGFVLNDLSAEFNAASPIFGEKAAPGWLPISFRDWTGREVARTYCDEFGTYEALVPSTINAAVPMPSGFAPNIITLVLNDPTMPDPANPANRVPDPYYNPGFVTAPWSLHYYPGTYLYADTPIVPIAAFITSTNGMMDVNPPTGTPVIKNVTTETAGTVFPGPWLQDPTGVVVIESLGTLNLPDPTCVMVGCDKTITRDYGFGTTAGSVTLTRNDGSVVPLELEVDASSWTDARIRARIPVGTTLPLEGRLMITRAAGGAQTPMGVTLTVDPTLTLATSASPGSASSPRVRLVTPVDPVVNPLATPIQDAIDAANRGDLIIVPMAPWEYAENPILNKAVRLQGAGVATVINGNAATTSDRLAYWHAKANTVFSAYGGDPYRGAGEAGVITVVGNADFNPTTPRRGPSVSYPVRIDGFTLKGSIAGGGISVYTAANNLRISNNRITGNKGTAAGGISFGLRDVVGTVFNNTNAVIEFNQIVQNGSDMGPGGIALYTGQYGYKVCNNYIVGNFTMAAGAGIGHDGCSPGGLIANNVIAYNECFKGVVGPGVPVSGEGGGIYIAGELLTAPAGTTVVGAGSVTIINNLIQGNLAGSGDGGGIRVAAFNGQDVAASNNPLRWYQLKILNNVIVNNVSAIYGGGISLQDATRVSILHNTIANNDSLATAQAAFGTSLISRSGAAGVVSHLHSATLASVSRQAYSDPELVNNIIWHNRSYQYNKTINGLVPAAGATSGYADLGVDTGSGLAGQRPLNPRNCLLSGAYTGGLNNQVGDPGFEAGFVNANAAALTVDEAGNNIAARFSPLGLHKPDGSVQGNYHLGTGSAAFDKGATLAASGGLEKDLDGHPRTTPPDLGADEYVAGSFSIVPPQAVSVVVSTARQPFPENIAPTAATSVTAVTPPGAMVQPGSINAAAGDLDNRSDDDGDGDRRNDFEYVSLAAGDGFARMADGVELYTFGFSDMTTNKTVASIFNDGLLAANVSGPTIKVRQGRDFYIDLSNVGMLMRPDLFDPHTVHFHGFPQAAAIFDGEPMGSISINMGGTLRYYYRLVEPGTYFYHCHVEATEHIQMGMTGNLWVYPKQNNGFGGTTTSTNATRARLNGGSASNPLGYAYNDGDGSTAFDVEMPLQITGFDREFHEKHIAVQPLPFSTLHESYPLFNGRGYPDTINTQSLTNSVGKVAQRTHSLINAKVGQRILLRISSVSDSDFHSISVAGIPMRVIAKDARLLRRTGSTENLSYQTTSVTLGGGETADAILDTAGLKPGTYVIYSTRLNFLSNDQEDFGGLMTEIVLAP